MRRGLIIMGLLGGLLLSATRWASADLFDTAREAVRADLGRADLSGITLRGGAGLASGLDPAHVTILQGRATIGAPCGAFDFATSLTQAFEELPGLFEVLIEQLLGAMPMLVLCYTSPTLCDLAKHFQALVHLAIQAKYAQCHQVQLAMAYGGQRLRGGHVSQCLEAAVAQGYPISEALRLCSGEVISLRTPAGAQAAGFGLVQETLGSAGVTLEMQALARNLLGEVTLSTNGGQLSTAQERPQAALLQRYELHRLEAEEGVRLAMEELRQTGQVSEPTLRAISVPGQAIPRAAIEGLVALERDPVRMQSLRTKLATGVAIVHLTWECQELQEQLAAAAEANSHLTDEQRRLLEQRLAGLQRDLHQVTTKKEVLERHLQPALEALLTEYSAVQHSATQAGFTAPSRVVPTMPYRTQQPAGYAQ